MYLYRDNLKVVHKNVNQGCNKIRSSDDLKSKELTQPLYNIEMALYFHNDSIHINFYQYRTG